MSEEAAPPEQGDLMTQPEESVDSAPPPAKKPPAKKKAPARKKAAAKRKAPVKKASSTSKTEGQGSTPTTDGDEKPPAKGKAPPAPPPGPPPMPDIMEVLAPPESIDPGEERKRPFYEPGWYKDISNDGYHGSFGYSSSRIKDLLENTPASVAYNMAQPDESTASKRLGTLFHCLVLEPEKFAEEFALAPDWNLRRPTERDARDEFEAKMRDEKKTIITPDQLKVAAKMARNVRSHPIASILLSNGVRESSVYWWYNPGDRDDTADYKGMMMKCRPDWLCRDHPVIIDLKSSKDPTFTGFQKDAINYGYDLSAAMYMEGVNQCKPLLEEMGFMAYTTWLWLVVGNEPPYEVVLYEMEREAAPGKQSWMDLSKQKYRRAAYNLHRAINDGWPSFDPGIRILEAPAWANRLHIV